MHNRSAIESYFEEWYEGQPHVCISETGKFFRLRFNRFRGVIEPILDEKVSANKDMFKNLMSQYLDTIEHRPELQQAVATARKLLQEGTQSAMKRIRAMADILGFD